jgi:hypothetical protein
VRHLGPAAAKSYRTAVFEFLAGDPYHPLRIAC